MKIYNYTIIILTTLVSVLTIIQFNIHYTLEFIKNEFIKHIYIQVTSIVYIQKLTII